MSDNKKIEFKVRIEATDSTFEMPLREFESAVKHEIEEVANGLRQLFFTHYRGPKNDNK